MPSEHTEGLLRIGEVARLLNLSVGTLRHYEQMGLLEPAYVDPTSGYRYYGSRSSPPSTPSATCAFSTCRWRKFASLSLRAIWI